MEKYEIKLLLLYLVKINKLIFLGKRNSPISYTIHKKTMILLIRC